jgi:glycine cleavage system H lipoate-binding protein
MNTSTHTIIPDSESHCVWMDAGLVNYKLCNCRFECDSCPFDKVMREQHQTFAEQAAMQSEYVSSDHRIINQEKGDGMELIERFLAPLKSFSFPEDRIYFSNHTWMKSIGNGMFRMGIDQFVAQLIYPITGVATVHTPSHMGRGEPYAWLIRDSSTYAVHNNEKGIASQINSKLMDHPSLVTNDPYGEGWIMGLSCSVMSPANLKFYTAGEFKDFIQDEVEDISHEMKKNKHSVGTTMFDGGMRIENMEKFIGEKRYTKLLLRLLSPH